MMKSQRGITLTSLIIYIVAMLIVMAIIATLTSYFYQNVNKIGADVSPAKEFTKFTSFFTEDVNKKNNKIVECSNDGDYIIFMDGTQYKFKEGNVYKNKAKICEDIFSLKFDYVISDTGKEVIEIKYKYYETDTDEKTEKFVLAN